MLLLLMLLLLILLLLLLLPRRPGLLGRRRQGLGSGRRFAALGAAVLVTGHLAHLDEAAVEARQVLQGATVLHTHIVILCQREGEGGI